MYYIWYKPFINWKVIAPIKQHIKKTHFLVFHLTLVLFLLERLYYFSVKFNVCCIISLPIQRLLSNINKEPSGIKKNN